MPSKYSYQDLLDFNAAYPSFTPDKTAGVFGVELPPPAPALPPEPEPVLVAGNLGKQNKTVDAVLDATGKPNEVSVGDLMSSGALAGTPFAPPAPKKETAALPSDVTAIAGAAGYKPAAPQQNATEYNPFDPYRERTVGDITMRRAKPEEKKSEGGAQDADLAAAQALEAQAYGGQRMMGGGGRGGSAAGVAYSESSRAKDFEKASLLTGDKWDRQMGVPQKQEALDSARVELQRDQAKATADRALQIAETQDKLERLGIERENRLAQREQAFADSEKLINSEVEGYKKSREPSAGGVIANAIAYALAGFGNAMTAKAGGQPQDTIGQIIKLQNDKADREHAKFLDTIKNLRVSQDQKQALMNKADAQLIAKRELLMDDMNMGLEKLKAINGGQLGMKEAEIMDKAFGLVRAQREADRGTKVESLGNAIYEQRQAAAAAAAFPGINLKQAEKDMGDFVPTGGGGKGFIAYDSDSAKAARTQLLANVKLNELYKAQIADVRELEKQGWGERGWNAATGDTGLIDRIEKRSLDMAATQNVIIGGGAMSKDEADMHLKTRTLGNPTSLRGAKLKAYVENVKAAQGTMDSTRRSIEQTFGKSFGGKQMLPDGRAIFVPESTGQTLPSFAGPPVTKKR